MFYEQGGESQCLLAELEACKLYNPSRWLDGSESFGEVKEMIVPEQIAVIEGSSGNHDLTLFYTDAQGAEQQLKYKGGASAAHAYNQAGSSYNEAQYQQGQRYVFSSSTTGVLAGEVIAVGSLKLSVHNGDSYDPTGETRVRARLYSPCVGVKLAEQVLYGSERLGVYRAEKVLGAATTENPTVRSEGKATITEDIRISSYEQINEYVLAEGVEMTVTEGFSYSYQDNQEEFHIHFGEIKRKGQYYAKVIGKRQYELKDHLGNVRVLISDRKLAGDDTDGDGVAESKAEVLASYNYYAFGMMQPGRTFEGSADYRFGFNGMEKDDEIVGSGNIYTAEYWQYDSRLGRRWNQDPKILIGVSPYSVNGGNPIYYVDPQGDFRTRFGAWLYKLANGGEIEESSNGAYYVSKRLNYGGEGAGVYYERRFDWNGGNKSYEASGWGHTERSMVANILDVNGQANTLVDLGMNSILQSSEVQLNGDLLNKVKQDPAIIALENSIVSNVSLDPRLGKEFFTYEFSRSIQLGGKRGSLNPLDPSSIDTWKVGVNPLTWAVRSVTVYAQIQVNMEGCMNITYSFQDKFDLRPENGNRWFWGGSGDSPFSNMGGRRPWQYNGATSILGIPYHDVVGGNDQLKVKATWSSER